MRVGIIGTGAVSHKHAQAYRNIGYELIACTDINPEYGITGTPVIDVASNTAYLFSKGYDAANAAIVSFHAVDATSLAERAGFRLIKTNKHNEFGRTLVGETWKLELEKHQQQ